MSKQKLLFIVDDDPFINMLVVKRFTSEGYNIEAFEYGEDCINSLHKNPDLIILDYFFVNNDREVMNGMEVFDGIKARAAARTARRSGRSTSADVPAGHGHRAKTHRTAHPARLAAVPSSSSLHDW